MSDTARKKTAQRVAMALGLGTNLLAGFVMFTWLGWWVDHRRGGGSAFTLAGIFLSFVWGGYEVWKVVRTLDEEAAQSGRRPGKDA